MRALAPLGGALRVCFFAGALSCALSCADDDDSTHSPSSGGAASAGEAGSVGDAGAENGGTDETTGQAGSSEHSAGAGGTAGADETGGSGATAGGGAKGSGGAPARCFADRDCDDGRYCNGIEYCKLLPDSEFKVCMGPEHGPCGPNICDEKNHCDCSIPDQDGDGFDVEGCATPGVAYDCDDTDGDRSPTHVEVCDDDHRDHDEDCRDDTFGTLDADGDQFIDENCTNKLDYQPLLLNQVLRAHGSDCADDDRYTHPGAIEVCDGRDNNCNGVRDEVSGAPGDAHTYYRDRDGDLYGSDKGEDALATLCNSAPPGYAVQPGDCDDSNPRVNPGREEICDGLDNDCDPDHKVDQPEKPGNLLFLEPYDGITGFECAPTPTGTIDWKVKTCPPARLDCNAKYQDACETIGTTLCNCHACGKTCSFSCGVTGCAEIVALSEGDIHTCALVQQTASTTSGTVACWGRNNLGQLGNQSTKDSLLPLIVPDLKNVTAIATGNLHDCVIGENEQLFCWGNNASGQLGTAMPDKFVPYPVKVYQRSDLAKAKHVGAGAFHSCAIYDEGRLACWGQNDSGQLGTANTTNSSIPVRVLRLANGTTELINDASQVVAGFFHSCSLSLSAGKVECWGDNSGQQLGIDPAELSSSNQALLVPGLDALHIDELSASAFHTCARAGADVYCWGNNGFHELGLDPSVDSAGPTKIELPAAAVAIATGMYFACALVDTKQVYCWGSNHSGVLGSVSESVQPTLLQALENVTGIFGGLGAHLCAVTQAGDARCWGKNKFGELGNGEATDDPQPTPVRVHPPSGNQTCVSSN